MFAGSDASGGTAAATWPISVSASVPPSVTAAAHLINLSARAYANFGENVLVAGFAVSGNTANTKPVLMRGIGPGLAQFGVANSVTKAALTLFSSNGQVVYFNDGWGTDPLLSSTAAQVGAFALPSNSGDSAIVWSLYPGTYTVQAGDDSRLGGNAMVELYDATPNDTTTRLINISARANLGTYPVAGLTGGFSVSGSGTETILVRGIGPALQQFGIASAASALTLTLFDHSGQPIAQNSGWPATAAINGAPVNLADVFAKVGAFPLPNGSADCAILVTLPAGLYTAQLGQSANSSGQIGLIEIYEVPTQ